MGDKGSLAIHVEKNPLLRQKGKEVGSAVLKKVYCQSDA